MSATAVRRTSSVELVRRCLASIFEHDAGLRAVLAIDPTAVEQAEAADRRRRAGASLGPLDGVPLLVKDNIDAAGLPCTAGSPLLAGQAPPSDATVVARLRAAGVVVLGKTNLSEWGNFRSTALPEGWSGLGGQTRNPHDPTRTAWGSSSGSAVAVAAGMAPLALGTETDGSVVGPAGMVGVVGLRPQAGLLPAQGLVPVSPPCDVPGVLAPTLRAAAGCLSVMAGAGPGRAQARPTDLVPPADLAGLRLGVWRVPGMPATSDAVLDDAVARLRAAGAVAVPVDAGVDDGLERTAAYARLAEFAEALPDYLRARGCAWTSVAELVSANRADGLPQEVFEHAAALDTDERELLAAEGAGARAAARAQLAAVLRDRNVAAVLAPTNPPAWPLADRDPPGLPASSTPAALAGVAAVSLPAGTVGGLPVGVSVFGPPTVAGLLPIALAVEGRLPGPVRGVGTNGVGTNGVGANGIGWPDGPSWIDGWSWTDGWTARGVSER